MSIRCQQRLSIGASVTVLQRSSVCLLLFLYTGVLERCQSTLTHHYIHVHSTHLSRQDDSSNSEQQKVDWWQTDSGSVRKLQHLKDQRVEPQKSTTMSTSDVQTASYSKGDMCSAPATGVGYHSPGQLHSAVLTGLLPGATYSYVITDQVHCSF
jgi:hypothetical protein